MIKKLLSFIAVAASFGTASAQLNLAAEPATLTSNRAVIESPSIQTASNLNEKSSAISVGDTLWYFFNKTFYKNPGGNYYTFNIAKTATVITHAGSRFQNTGNLAVVGLEALLSRAVTASSTASARLILCNVVSGQPVLPGLDSVTVVVGTATNTSGYFYGGNFTTPKFVSGDYAVVVRNASASNNDTIRVWMTNGLTTTFGEGLGHMRAFGSFTNTTNLFSSPTNNDFEILVAPRVGFTASAAQTSPAGPLCTNNAYNFNNNSSYYLGHRQYNLNEFYRRWRPFTNTITAIAADSVFTWNFGDGTGNFYTPTSTPNINHVYTAAGTFNGTLTAKYQKQVDSGVKLQDAVSFSKTVSTCAGIATYSGIEAVILFPNPSNNGFINISNLPSESSIEVVNMLGQSVYKDKAEAGSYAADLSSLPNGSYFVKISPVNERTKIVKLILN